MTLDDIFTGILKREGWPKYTNDPIDKGGPTKGGITLETLKKWYKKTKPSTAVTAEDVKALTERDVRAIYQQMYVKDWRFDSIPDEWVKVFVVDTGVLQGQGEAAKMLQRVLHVPQDAIIGPTTLASLMDALVNPVRLKTLLIQERMHLLLDDMVAQISMEERQTTNLKYRHGWWNRVCEFL